MQQHPHRLVFGIAVLVVVVCGVWAIVVSSSVRPSVGMQSMATSTYSSATYDYSFTYPASYSADEYSPEYVAIGTPIGTDGFNAVANSDVATASASDGYATYQDFVYATAMNDCAADGPNGSISCTAVATSTPYTAVSGAGSIEFYLTQVATINGTTATSTRGPFYAFDLSSTIPSFEFGVLLVHVPMSGDDASNTAVVVAIAHSLQIK